MKNNIFVLHSLNGDTLEMWGKEVKENFEGKSIEDTIKYKQPTLIERGSVRKISQ